MQRGRMELACRRLGGMLQQPLATHSAADPCTGSSVPGIASKGFDGDLQVLKLWSRARRRLELTLQQEELLLAHHFRPKMPR